MRQQSLDEMSSKPSTRSGGATGGRKRRRNRANGAAARARALEPDGNPKVKSRRGGGRNAGGHNHETNPGAEDANYDVARMSRVRERVAMMLTAEEKQTTSWQHPFKDGDRFEVVAFEQLSSYGPVYAKNRYFLGDKLGEGSFSSVFRAWDEEHQEWVALKFTLSSGGKEEYNVLERLQQAAEQNVAQNRQAMAFATDGDEVVPDGTSIIKAKDCFDFTSPQVTTLPLSVAAPVRILNAALYERWLDAALHGRLSGGPRAGGGDQVHRDGAHAALPHEPHRGPPALHEHLHRRPQPRAHLAPAHLRGGVPARARPRALRHQAPGA
jgi:hypothetical protein